MIERTFFPWTVLNKNISYAIQCIKYWAKYRFSQPTNQPIRIQRHSTQMKSQMVSCERISVRVLALLSLIGDERESREGGECCCLLVCELCGYFDSVTDTQWSHISGVGHSVCELDILETLQPNIQFRYVYKWIMH